MAELRRRLIAAVDRKFHSDDPQFTVEVDAVGHSMGGLIARYAAAPSDDTSQSRRLKINRLFTIATPHTGAGAARHGVTRFHKDLAPDSAFLKYLDAHFADASYTLIPYALLGDKFVGTPHTAPPGQSPWWLASTALFRHPSAMSDRRILADIARRLRDEEPFTHAPPTSLPSK
jgi:pimeloyl-ACP methyl ester carboxylesterase